MLRVHNPARAACALAFVFAAVAPAQAPGRNDERPPQVAGQVRGVDGTPVAEARVQLTGLGHPELPPTVAWALGDEARVVVDGVTDARGVFKIALPHRGPFTLIATAPDGATTGRRFPVLAGDFINTRVQPRSVVTGVVHNADGTPAVGALLQEAPYNDRGNSRERHGYFVPSRPVQADAQGRFRLEIIDSDPEGLTLSPRSFHAWGRGMRSSQSWYRIDGQSLHDVDVRLADPSQLSGTIVATAVRTPLADARLLDLEAGREVAHTAADGTFAFDNAPLHALAVRAPRYAIAGYPANGLSVGGVVRARLLGPDGTATRRRVALATRDSVNPFHIAWLTHTDAEGRLEIDEARIGDPLYAFVEIDGGFVSFFAGVPTTRPRDLGEIHVGRGGSLTGTVLAADGLRVSAATVLLQPVLAWDGAMPMGSTSLAPFLTRMTYTDRAGRFRFDHVPKTAHRCLIVAGLAGVRMLEVQGGNDLGSVQLDDTVTTTITASLADGTRAAHASVQYVAQFDGEAQSFGMHYLFGRADAEGQFTVRGLPAHRSFTTWGMVVRDGNGFLGNNAGPVVPGAAGVLSLRGHSGRF